MLDLLLRQMKKNNTEVDSAKDIDKVMSMYNLIEYSDNNRKKLGVLVQYYRDEPSFDNNGNDVDFTGANHNSKLFQYKQKITDQTSDNSRKRVKIMVRLKYSSNFWRTFEVLLVN